MLPGNFRRTITRFKECLESIIVNGTRQKLPDELIEHLYKKEYGLTTYEFMREPIDRIGIFLKIKDCENRRDEIEARKLKK